MFAQKLSFVIAVVFVGSFCFAEGIINGKPIVINVEKADPNDDWEGTIGTGLQDGAVNAKHFVCCTKYSQDVLKMYCPDSEENDGDYNDFTTNGDGDATFWVSVTCEVEDIGSAFMMTVYVDNGDVENEYDSGDDFVDYAWVSTN